MCLDQGLAQAARYRGELEPLAVNPGIVMSLPSSVGQSTSHDAQYASLPDGHVA